MAEQDGFTYFDAPSRAAAAAAAADGRGSWASDAGGRVLLLDGDALVRDSIARTLDGGGHDVVAVADAAAAVARLQGSGRLDLLLADVSLPRTVGGGGGGDVFAAASRLRPLLPTVAMTGYAGLASAVEVVRRGAYDYLQKPFDKQALLLLVGRAMGHAALRHENRALRAASIRRAAEVRDEAAELSELLPLAEVEKRVILDALAKFEGHRARTAGALGIGVRTLGIKLKKWRDDGVRIDAGR